MGTRWNRRAKLFPARAAAWLLTGHSQNPRRRFGGYFLLKVDSMEEAVAIAQECPGLPFGIKVEVRQIMEQCPAVALASREAQLAEA